MRRLISIALLCAFLTTPVLADTVATVNDYGIWQTGSGGEFTLQPSAGLQWVLPLYVGSTKNQGTQDTFQTFCLEEHEYIYANTTFDVVLNNKAVNGGVGPQGDLISVGTAWLYHSFQNQTLDGYDYVTDAGRHASADALQRTIWWLEGEAAGDPGTGNAFRQAVITQFGNADGAMANNNGQYAVAVLNLYAQGHAGDANYLRQDQLVCVPLPAALLLGLLGLSAAGLKLRKFA